MMGLAKLYKWNEVNERVEREPEIRIDKVDVAVLDPPRAGCEEVLLRTFMDMAPEKIVYVSCDPATLARDLDILCHQGQYKLKKVQPVDMFPRTAHVEGVGVLYKK